MRLGVAAAVVCLSIVGLANADDVRAAIRRPTNIPAQSLGAALQQLARDRNFQVVYVSEEVNPLRTEGAVGEFTREEALKQLLKGTGLTYRYLDEQTITIFPASTSSSGSTPGQPSSATPLNSDNAQRKGGWNSPFSGSEGSRVAQNDTNSSQLPQRADQKSKENPESRTGDSESSSAKGIPEILVEGSRILNMDVRRTQDDPQPWVVFDRKRIEQSGGVNLEDFLKQRLTMNTVGSENAQKNTTNGSASTVNLRGLGSNQTLILIDGHRTAPLNINSGSIAQPDLNGIPLAAVERIEVLPATASGIYGGSATGGVLNIVMRRDYAGVQAGVSYENAFDSDAGLRRVDLSAGFGLEGGKTNVLLTGSYVDNNNLLVQDRSLYARGAAAIIAHNGNNIQALSGTNPPLGATSNIRSSDGTPLILKNGTALNSPITYIPVGYAGTMDGGTALVPNAGKYNLALASSAQNDPGGGLALLSQPTVESGSASIRRTFGSRLQGFLDLSASNQTSRYPVNNIRSGTYSLPATAPNNPFVQAISVTAPLPGAEGDQMAVQQQRRAVGGLIFQLPANWHAEADYTWSRSRQFFSSPGARLSTLSPAVSAGTVDVMRDTTQFPVNLTPYIGPQQVNTPQYATLKDTTARLSGPIGSLPAGEPTLSILFEHRDENFSDGYFNFILPTLSLYFPAQSQKTDSAYAELRVPLLAATKQVPGARELELQIAGRYDDYTMYSATGSVTVGANTPIAASVSKQNSANPTFALRYMPVQDLTLRASYGTGFLPPTFSQILPSLVTVPVTVIDPRRGNANTVVQPGPTSIQGGNPNVKPEKSTSWSVGAILMPRFLEGLRLSVDWVRVEKTGNIATLSQQGIVNDELSLPGRVTRNTDPATFGTFGVGPIIGIDRTAVNLAQAQAEAIDFSLDYQVKGARAGDFDFFAVATQQTTLRTKTLPTDAWIEKAGVTASNPLKLKANFGFDWHRESWLGGWSSTYYDSYYVADPAAAASAPIFVNQGSRKVKSQTYHDVFAGYRFVSAGGNGGMAAWLANGEVRLGIKNIFNTKPPIDVSQFGSLAYYSPFGDPRLARYYLTLTRNF